MDSGLVSSLPATVDSSVKSVKYVRDLHGDLHAGESYQWESIVILFMYYFLCINIVRGGALAMCDTCFGTGL